ncbi:hypothetical protein AB0H34_28620 [Saccharopolyspora shandongensis]|uniref:hypothetical protein n=1 Tax=Saccharopolyspora shandongensis TaxID=418495 RepID=UPI0033DB9B29
MTRWRVLAAASAVLFLSSACGSSERQEQAALATTACQVQVRSELERQGTPNARFSSSSVADGKPDGWIVQGLVDVGEATRSYECRVVPSAADKLRGKEVVDVSIT